jgi:hypothetical protein
VEKSLIIMALDVYVIKLFPLQLIVGHNKVMNFSVSNYFQPSLIFSGKAMALENT